MYAPSWRAATMAVLSTLLLVAHSLEVQDGKLQSVSSAGIAEHTATFPSDKAASKVVTLSSLSTLKLSYTIAPALASSYSALILSSHDERALASQLGEATNSSISNKWRMGNSQVKSVTIPVTPKKGGRYRYEWDLSSPSAAYKEDILTVARLGSGRLKAQLMVVNSNEASNENFHILELGTISILDEDYYKDDKVKQKYPREWEMERYNAREEIAWTFQEARKPVSAVKALIGLGAVLGPWLLLVGLLGQIMPSLLLSGSATSSALPFLVSLVALEGSIASYWIGFITVWTFMPCVVAIGLLAILTGKSALGYQMDERTRIESNRAVGLEKKSD